MRKKLTNSMVEAFTGDGATTGHPVLWCGELKGFGLRYAVKSQVRTYIYHGRIRGSNLQRTITIGRHNDPWRVDQARARATALKAQMLDGIDPVAERKAAVEQAEQQAKLDEAQSVSLQQILDSYIDNKRTKHGELRPKTKKSMRDTIERNLSDWLDLPMAATVTRDACLVRFTELSDNEINKKTGKPGKKSSATQTFMYLRALCNFARDRYENEDGTPRIFLTNPVTRMTKVRRLNPIKASTRRIPKDRIAHVWTMLQDRRVNAASDVERTAADWVCFMILTGTRLSESGSLKRADVNLEAKTVRLRGDIVKNHHDLTLPLSTVLHEILSTRLTMCDDDSPAARRRHRPRSTEYVFPSFGLKQPFLTDARATMRAVSKVAGVKVTPHDLRRTYEDILKFAKVDPDERRLLLNHISGDVHQLSYSNDENAEALRPSVESACQWILTQARIAAAPNVIQFPAKTA